MLGTSGKARGTARWSLAIASALAISALFASTASATDYEVSVTSDNITNDPICTLREAVQAANTNAAFNGCPAGGGIDTIELTSADPYELTIDPAGNPDDNLTGDLDITALLSIIAPDDAEATIFQTDADRLFHVQSPALLFLRRLHVAGGAAGGSDGGAVLAATGAGVDAFDVVFEDNTAAGGGAIAAANVSVANAHFIFNDATANDGGAVKLTEGTQQVIARSSFELNTAADQGGAIWIADDSNSDIWASTFLDNEADTGSAIHEGTTHGSSDIDYVTIAGNQAQDQDGGALTVVDSAGTEVTRSILAQNTDPDGPSNCDVGLADTPDNEYNLIDVNDCGLTPAGGGNNLLGVAPDLAPANVYFGGPTVSRPPFVDSPAVNAIPLAACGGSPLDQDQYGTDRPQPAGGSCDVGAVEGAVARPIVTPPATTPPVTTPVETGQRAKALKKCKKKAKKKDWSKKQLKKCKRRARRLPV